MDDIRKPYKNSRSNRITLAQKVEKFENGEYDDEENYEPVAISKSSFKSRRNIDNMEMFPKKRETYYDDEGNSYSNRRNDKGGSFKKIGFGLFVIAVAGVAFIFTYILNSATITVTPKFYDVENFNKVVKFTKLQKEEGEVNFTLATTTASKEKTLPLSETKKIEAKASGKIVIYNNYSSDPQKLIKNTRFESLSGKIYRINQSITVPGKKGDTPGSVEATIYAESVGSLYNSGPTDFTIPGFKDGDKDRYTKFFARSKGDITGGVSGDKSTASISDINAAKDELEIELTQEVKDMLSKTKESGYESMPSAIYVEFEDNINSVKTGDTSVYKVKATGYMMLAKSDDLAKVFAKELSDFQNKDVRLSYSDQISYSRKDGDNPNSVDSLDILVSGSPRVIMKIDESSLKESVLSKARDEFRNIMNKVPSIKSAEIQFSPFWLSNFPNEERKIKVIESLPKR